MQFQCISCKSTYPINKIRYRCSCHGILDVVRKDRAKLSPKTFDARSGAYEFPYASGVWRYGELLPPLENKYIFSQNEGNTPLYEVGRNVTSGYASIGKFAAVDALYLKHEGHNPTGSFKDRGMTVGVSFAKKLGVKTVACASTGNTSSSLASYAAFAGLTCIVYLPEGKITASKLAQTIAYGAKIKEVDGDFDQAMKEGEEASIKNNIYLLNSINPFRIEGQKTIAFELLQQLNWKSPDWIVIPGGNLGNTAAIGKGILELFQIGLISQIPQIATIQAKGANPFYQSFIGSFQKQYVVKAETIATAIRIGNPVSFQRAAKIIEVTSGVVEKVTDAEILAAKSVIDRSGIGCEPASATTVAGIKKLVERKIIKKHETVAAILTGHILKDPDTITKFHT